MLGPGANVQPPEARISRGLEVHPEGGGVDLDVWIDRSLIRRGYAWSVPADGEQRVGVGSYEPRDHVKEPTREIAARVGVPPVRYQGNWFPHQLREAAEDGVFFAGDSAGHCFPLSGEGIRTAFYFGIACGRELRAVLAGEQTREQALAAYGAFSRRHARAFAWALTLQRAIPALPPRLLARAAGARGRRRVSRPRLRLVPAPGRPGVRSAADAERRGAAAGDREGVAAGREAEAQRGGPAAQRPLRAGAAAARHAPGGSGAGAPDLARDPPAGRAARASLRLGRLAGGAGLRMRLRGGRRRRRRSSGVGVGVVWGTTVPVPVSATSTCCGPAGSRLSVAARGPVAPGAKRIAISHVPSPGTPSPHVLRLTSTSSVWPLTSTATGSVAGVEFSSVTVFGAPMVPTGWFPNARLDGPAVSGSGVVLSRIEPPGRPSPVDWLAVTRSGRASPLRSAAITADGLVPAPNGAGASKAGTPRRARSR